MSAPRILEHDLTEKVNITLPSSYVALLRENRRLTGKPFSTALREAIDWEALRINNEALAEIEVPVERISRGH